MKAKYYGHSAVYVESNSGHRIIIDPFIEHNPHNDLKAQDIKVDTIILTHGHDDHVGDTVEIAKANDALVIAPVELADYLASFDLNTHGMNLGGYYDFDFGRVKYVQAFHSSSTFVDGQTVYLGPATGVLLYFDDKTLYHLGDTALFSDLKLIGETNDIDLAFIPIGSNFTMGPEDALLAAKWLKAKTVIPIHYNTFPVIEQNGDDFIQQLEDKNGIVAEIGQWINS